ncbi:MAG TPA: helix-turn-helix domain-containing protein [Miltoncostaeaceae bacterium]|nr:helix-turn-helix domain-containing protein [Miltoncostaeaceae bacterium]
MFEIGTALRTARRKQGLDLDDVEASTKIRARQLQALEQEHFELLPERAYARAFLRTYAIALGLDPKPFMDEFDERFPEEDELPPPEEMPRASRLGAAAGLVRTRVVWFAVGGLGLIALAVSSGLWSSSGGSPSPAARTPPPAAPASIAASPPPARAAAVPRLLTLKLTGLGQAGSWVTVHRGDATGETLFEGTLAGGASRRFTSKAPLWIRVGWAPRLRATVDGRVVVLTGGTASFMVRRGRLEPAQPSA